MGAHAGILFFDRRPVGPACRQLQDGLSPLALDGVSVHAEDGIAMAVAACHVWAGERSSEQPRQSPAGLAIAWDGRLDNREDLISRMHLDRSALCAEASGDRRPGDAEIVLSAFERWGVDGLYSLIGEWSTAIWDGRERTLHLARDYMGVRPLYFCADDRFVAWSSDLGELARRSGRVDALKDEFVSRFLIHRFSPDVTPYTGVRAVPPATCVSFSATRVETRRRFWDLTPAIFRFSDKRMYEERLRELWREAVAARLRTSGTVWADLSGGLDSSSVVCMADLVIKSGQVAAHAVQPISHVTLQSREGDERRFIAAVEEQIGVRSRVFGVEDHQDAIDDDLSWVSPCALYGVSLACARHVRERDGRVVLSGRAGDSVMGCQVDNSVAALDDLADWRIVDALTALRQWSRSTRKPFIEIASNVVRAWRRPEFAIDAPAPEPKDVALLTPTLRRLVPIDNGVPRELLTAIRPSKRQLAREVLSFALDARFDVPLRPYGIVHTYPFTHRPLVEFMLAIPGEEVSAPGETRSLMRRAFRGIVPDRVLNRFSKGYYPPALLRGVRPLASSLLPAEKLEVVRRGWIDAAQLEAAVRMIVDGAGAGADIRPVLHLEHWLTSRKRQGPAVIPQGREVTTNEVLNT